MNPVTRLLSLVSMLTPQAAGASPANTASFAGQRLSDAISLMVAMARADGVFGDAERKALLAAAQQAGMSAADARRLADDAELLNFEDAAARLRHDWPHADRARLLTEIARMAWVDGSLGEIEEAMLERMARLIGVEPLTGPPAPEASPPVGKAEP